MGVSNGDEDGGGVDGDGSGGNSPSRQGAGTETSVPRTLVSAGGGATELFVDEWFSPRNFLGLRALIGEEATRGGAGVGQTQARCGQAWARAWALSGPLQALQHFIFRLPESSGVLEFL